MSRANAETSDTDRSVTVTFATGYYVIRKFKPQCRAKNNIGEDSTPDRQTYRYICIYIFFIHIYLYMFWLDLHQSSRV
jgi:hypothetical protein